MNSKRYWLTGGITGIVLGPIILYFIILLTAHPSGYMTSLSLKYMWLPLLITYGGAAAVGFIVGSIIGMVYSKRHRSTIMN